MQPKLTQTLVMHLNGSKFSTLTHKIMADGHDTGITRVCQTSGRPKYLKLSDKLIKGTQEYDLLAGKGGAADWILAHMDPIEA